MGNMGIFQAKICILYILDSVFAKFVHENIVWDHFEHVLPNFVGENLYLPGNHIRN